MTWETVIGLETHVELTTESKLFCSCSAAFGGGVNTQCCPVCTGMPGALPVLNGKAVEFAVKAGLVLGCKINHNSRFDRKNYFYPDLPKAYQITQFYSPLAYGGLVTFRTGGGEKTVRIHEMHLEEDAGKLTHSPESGRTKVDFNRCGVPLIEIVTEPDFRTATEAVDYLEWLRSAFRYLKISDCKMQEGSLRCDVNLSVRPKGSDRLGTRTEMKNLSSFRAVVRAVAFESARQISVLEAGGTIFQETRRWDEDREESLPMRGKEDARDYRYFPEPDLPPLVLSESYVEGLRCRLPELREEKRTRYMSAYQLSGEDAVQLTGQREIGEFFEAVVSLGTPPKEAANWILTHVLRQLSARGCSAGEMGLRPATLACLIKLVHTGRVNRNTAVEIFDAVFESGEDPEVYLQAHGMEQIGDRNLVNEAVDRVISDNPKSLADFLMGKEKAVGFLVGQTMRALGGRGDPKLVNEAVRAALTKERETRG